MNCDCSLYDFDAPKYYRETFPVAKKGYICCECGEVIPKGQKYNLAVGIWDNSWVSFRTCMTCYRIRRDFCTNGFVFGELREALRECLGIDYLTL